MITITILLIAIPVILIIALFKDTTINSSATIIVEQPRHLVFDYLASLKNQEHFNAWLMADPQMNIRYSGDDGLPGSILMWSSKHIANGNGSQQIINVLAPEKIEIEITFEQPVPTKARYHFVMAALSDTQTQVTWVFEGNSEPYYLLRVLQLLFHLKRRVIKYMELSLRNVKDQLETPSTMNI
jgi:hypothetical protein